ncbi:MAG: glycine cleavage system protein H [Thermoproteota archaeon]
MYNMLIYKPKRTWAQITSEGHVKIGLTDYAAKHLEGLARIHIEPVGEIRKDERFGVAETWMVVFGLYSPVSGKIVKVNDKLLRDPKLVIKDPYCEGWIIEIEPKNSSTMNKETEDMMSPSEYDEWKET